MNRRVNTKSGKVMLVLEGVKYNQYEVQIHLHNEIERHENFVGFFVFLSLPRAKTNLTVG